MNCWTTFHSNEWDSGGTFCLLEVSWTLCLRRVVEKRASLQGKKSKKYWYWMAKTTLSNFGEELWMFYESIRLLIWYLWCLLWVLRNIVCRIWFSRIWLECFKLIMDTICIIVIVEAFRNALNVSPIICILKDGYSNLFFWNAVKIQANFIYNWPLKSQLLGHCLIIPTGNYGCVVEKKKYASSFKVDSKLLFKAE